MGKAKRIAEKAREKEVGIIVEKQEKNLERRKCNKTNVAKSSFKYHKVN